MDKETKENQKEVVVYTSRTIFHIDKIGNFNMNTPPEWNLKFTIGKDMMIETDILKVVCPITEIYSSTRAALLEVIDTLESNGWKLGIFGTNGQVQKVSA